MFFFLKKPNSKVPTTIYLIYFIKEEGKNFSYSTELKIHPENWDFKARMPKTLRGGEGKKNKRIAIALMPYQKLLQEIIDKRNLGQRTLNKNMLRDAFNHKFRPNQVTNERPKGITDMVQTFIDIKSQSKGKSKSWMLKYGNLKKKLQYFEEEKGKVKIDTIDGDWLEEYCGFLRTIKKEPFSPHNDNTLHRNITFLFTFLKWSKGKYHNIDMTNISNPVKPYQSDDIHLSTDEVVAIENYSPPRKSLERARDLFLIGVYSGQRFSDYSVFEKADVMGDFIIKKAEKTEYESYIPLHPKLLDLLNKYNWKLPKISSQKFNPNIQEVCEKAGIKGKIKKTIYRGSNKETLYLDKHKMVTSHTARRTFITLSAERGMPDHIIMKITGIRDPKTLTKYKKTAQHSIREQMLKHWG